MTALKPIFLADDVYAARGDMAFGLATDPDGRHTIMAGKLLGATKAFLEVRDAPQGPLVGLRSVLACMLEYRDGFTSGVPASEVIIDGRKQKAVLFHGCSMFSTLDAAQKAAGAIAARRQKRAAAWKSAEPYSRHLPEPAPTKPQPREAALAAPLPRFNS